MTPYPPLFPSEAVGNVVAKVRGQDVPLAVLLHSAWEVQGYAMNAVLPDPPPAMSSARSGAVSSAQPLASPVEVADALEKHLHFHLGGRNAALGAGLVPWDVLLPLITNLILEWLKSRG